MCIQEGIWGGYDEVNGVRTLITARVLPGYVTCEPQGRLPGCLFKFDDISDQCSEGRTGEWTDQTSTIVLPSPFLSCQVTSVENVWRIGV